MNNKAIIEFGFLGGCYPTRPSASVDNTLLDLQNSSYPTQPHSIIAKYFRYKVRCLKCAVRIPCTRALYSPHRIFPLIFEDLLCSLETQSCPQRHPP